MCNGSGNALDRRVQCTSIALIVVGAIGCVQFLGYELVYGIFGGASGVMSIVAGSMPLCCMTERSRLPILRGSTGIVVACSALDGIAITWQVLFLIGVNEAADDLGGWTAFLNAWLGVALGISVVSLLTHVAGAHVLCSAVGRANAAARDVELAAVTVTPTTVRRQQPRSPWRREEGRS